MNAVKIFFYILVPAFFISIFVYFTISGPKEVGPDVNAKEILEEISKEHEELRYKSLEVEGQFEEILSLRKFSKDDLFLLKNAVDLQKQYVEALPYYSFTENQRLEFLKERYDQLSSESYYTNSLNLEIASSESYESSNYLDAIEQISLAIEEQNYINEFFPLSSHYDINRITQLRRTLDYYEAYPIYNEINKKEKEVLKLAESGLWEEASILMSEVIEGQLYLNSHYRSSKLADSFKVSRLKRLLVKYESEPDFQKINKAISTADQYIQVQDYTNAAAYYSEALDLQIKLNEEFPDSPYSSVDKANDLIVKTQTAGSYDIGEMINTLNFQIDSDLRNRDIPLAINKIVKISDALQRVNEEFPKSAYNNRNLELKIKFLNYIKNDIVLIQDRVYARIVNVPNEPGIRMFDSEVSQAFYLTIMGFNPSRFESDKNPVESVSWEDANDFCKRLSWIMGLSVRLPKEYEFRSAIGRLRYIKLENHVVSYSEDQGIAPIKSKELMGEGFFDLLGNLSEWLYSEEAYFDEPAKHIGGHFRDNLETIFTVPLREANPNERSRLIGFRFILE